MNLKTERKKIVLDFLHSRKTMIFVENYNLVNLERKKIGSERLIRYYESFYSLIFIYSRIAFQVIIYRCPTGNLLHFKERWGYNIVIQHGS